MSITVGGSNITMNDSTVQATAYLGGRGQAFTANGTFTIPTGVTAVKVTVVGGGGGGWGGGGGEAGSGGSAGGAAIKFLTGLTSGGTLAVTIGSGGSTGVAGGTSSVASGTQTITTISATGGGYGRYQQAPSAQGGVGSNGDINIRGQGGSNPTVATYDGTFHAGGIGGASILGGGGVGGMSNGGSSATAGSTGGGGGGYASGGSAGVGTGGAGVVVFEW